MRHAFYSILMASAPALMAAPLPDAMEKTIQLSEEDKQDINEANNFLLLEALRFLHDSWPLEIFSPGTGQDDFHFLLESHAMLRQFSETGKLNLRTSTRNTPLHLCITLSLNNLANRMIEADAPVNAQAITKRDGTREPGDTPLTWACIPGIYTETTAEDRLPLVQTLLQHGADPDLAGPYGVTPFIIASVLNDNYPNQDQIALALLDAGNPDLKRRLDSRGRAAGFRSLSPAIYDRLIKAGCDVNERFFESKQSPLHLVCTKEIPAERLIPLMEQLIKAGADPNQVDVDGLTPLMACNSTEIAIFLMNNGANPSLRNEDGQTAYDFHLKNGYPDIAEAIKKWQSQQTRTSGNK